MFMIIFQAKAFATKFKSTYQRRKLIVESGNWINI